ncbi:MAG: hypothetical protein ABSH24_31730 [Bryobacteraceae bacterium]|jgi:hypothetical protein
MGLPKALKPLDRLDYLNGGLGSLGFVICDVTMGSIFKQTGGIHIDLYSLRCGLQSKFRLSSGASSIVMVINGPFPVACANKLILASVKASVCNRTTNTITNHHPKPLPHPPSML